MPKYDYKCEHCSHVEEVQHDYDKDPEIRCRICVGPTKKVIQKVATRNTYSPMHPRVNRGRGH